ncbi:hypothetical protein GS506_08800 [Rhodococcus hoagii]|nr:hypothetical protein [Prescottella equi]
MSSVLLVRDRGRTTNADQYNTPSRRRWPITTSKAGRVCGCRTLSAV